MTIEPHVTMELTRAEASFAVAAFASLKVRLTSMSYEPEATPADVQLLRLQAEMAQDISTRLDAQLQETNHDC